MPPVSISSIPDTLASMQVSLQRWFREPIDDAISADALNDGIESLWSSLILASLTMFMGGPVTNLSIANAAERVSVVSIVDPTALLVVSDTLATDGVSGGRTFDVAYTYVTESGTETNLSPKTTHTCAALNVGAVHPPAWIQGAMGWNCYARELSTGNLVKQNDEPLPFLTTSSSYFNEPDAGWVNDPDAPQPPTSNTTGDNIFFINHLEIQTPDGSYKSWNQADLDSDLMRRAERSLSSSSLYQNYVFDLINQQTLEIRPAAGTALSPRYFFIQKPRRLRFSNSPLPFLTVPYAGFLRAYALSLVHLSVHEYDAANAWEMKAEAERMRCLQSVLKMNTKRNNRITPYLM